MSFIIPKCDHKFFEALALVNQPYRMNLIQGRLEAMPVSFENGMQLAKPP